MAAALAALAVAGCGGAGGEAGTTSSAKPLADPGGHPMTAPTEDAAVLDFETELVALVNAHRVSLGLDVLADAGELRDVARAHSIHMIVHGFFGHVSPEGLAPGDRLDFAGIGWTAVGENLGAGYATPESVFRGWMGSPEHRRQLEDPEATHTGAGYARDATGEGHEHYWTQVFVRR